MPANQLKNLQQILDLARLSENTNVVVIAFMHGEVR